MNILKNITAFLCLTAGGFVCAQDELIGTWQGELALDAETSLDVEFLISRDDNSAYMAHINAPNNPTIRNLAASLTMIEGNSVSLEFASISGSYKGEINEQTLTGEWSQPGSSFPLTLEKYVVSTISESDKAALSGVWYGAIQGDPNETQYVFNFNQDAEGEMYGTMSIPRSGAIAVRPLSDFGMVRSNLVFSIGNDVLEGQLSGSTIEGVIDGGPIFTLTKQEALSSLTTNLTEEDREFLLGDWRGQIGYSNIAVRFEEDSSGDFVSFVDFLELRIEGVSVYEVSIAEGQLTLGIASGAEFVGDISEDEIVGEWTSVGGVQPVTLRKN